jgi:hypothetical protein
VVNPEADPLLAMKFLDHFTDLVKRHCLDHIAIDKGRAVELGTSRRPIGWRCA